ncbi:MAG: hypothetical protein QOH61_2082 [Chloroflexota bacterium]|nr:hypothetical protein [Chloroflexota bacterium]
MNAKRFLVSSIAAVLLIAVVGLPVLGNSKNNVIVSGSITQTHTLFFNSQLCHINAIDVNGYAITNWNERMQRTPGADRDGDTVWYRTVIDGALCSNSDSVRRDTGQSSYHPTFGASNDITWTLALNWPMIAPLGQAWSASSQKVYYTRRGGGPWVQSMCNNITLFNGGNWCPDL